MNFYTDLKIKSKLIVGYAVVVICCCLVGFLGFKGMAEIKFRLDDLYKNLIPSITTVAEIDRLTQTYRRIHLRYMLETGPQQRKALETRLTGTELAVKKSLEQFSTLRLMPKERELLNKTAALIQDFYDASGKMRSAVNSGTKYSELQAEHLRTRNLSDLMESSIKELSLFNADEAADHFEQSRLYYTQLRFWLSSLIIFSILVAISMVVLISRSISTPLRHLLRAVNSQQAGGEEKIRLVEAIASGDLGQEVTVTEPLQIDAEQAGRDEAGMLLRAFIGMSEVQNSLDLAFVRMTRSLRHTHEQETLRDWFKNGQNELNTILRGDKATAELTTRTLAFLAEYLGAGIGLFYLFDEEEARLRIAASYAITPRKLLNVPIALGEGLAGQAALGRKTICLNDAPPGYLPISSGLGEAEPVNIVFLPLLHNDVMVGIIEIGSFKIFSSNDLEFLEQSKEGIAIALSVNNSRQLVNELLEQTQGQTEELRVQQEELQQTNEELEERARMLEEKREQIRAKNRELEGTGRELQRKADELQLVSSYKSDFLANMSHELRTPLNSLMILSSLLEDNREGNLTAKQIEFAATINGAGRDLLNLINDILDLSKIESGHMEFHYEELTLAEICSQLETLFRPIAGEKGINFAVAQEESAPETIMTDSQRTRQILKNLLSNACKFTNKGSVSLRAYTPDDNENPLKTAAVAFAVTDTGIGIPADKQQLVFNAFQQADGSTSRTYGGTGLGLSISRQLARSMGGEIFLTSESGNGSTFTLYLPVKGVCEIGNLAQMGLKGETALLIPENPVNPIPDDRENIQSGARSILIIEDGQDQAKAMVALLEEKNVAITVADSGVKAIALLSREQFDCIVLDLGLADIGTFELLEELKNLNPERLIPVIIHTGRELSHENERRLNHYAESIIIKGAKSPERLLNEVTLFLHLVESPLGPDKQRVIRTALDKGAMLEGKKVLIVDDDMRNIFSLSSALAEKNITVFEAENGREALKQLEVAPDIDLVLMDIMMPEMDGYEAMRRIRKDPRFQNLPMIALTAKAMKGDREECLKAGASDYIPKPVNMEKLFSLLQVWLYSAEPLDSVDMT